MIGNNLDNIEISSQEVEDGNNNKIYPIREINEDVYSES